MPTRQYVGARYVPKFADPIAWDNANAYEALTIVTYNGTSYTSKKSVPAGTAITNTEYWVATGNYNAQVEAYREEVAALEQDFIELEAKVYPKYKNIILIGDSYGTSDGGGVTISHPLPERIQDYLGFDNDHFRASFYNGQGFGNGGFYTLFNNLASTMTDDEKAAVTDIYFLGGWNDESTRVTQEQFLTGVQNCETLISTKFAHATKHIVFISHSVEKSTLQNLVTTIGWYDGLESRGWVVDRNMRFVLINPSLYTSDGAHPNQNGVDALAKAFCDVVYCGQCDVSYAFTISGSEFTPETGIITNFTAIGGSLRFAVNNGMIGIDIYSNSNAWVFSFVDEQDQDTTKSITCNGTAIDLIDLTNKIPGYYANIQIPVQATIYDSSNAAHYINGTLKFAGNKISYRPGYHYNSAGTGALTLTAKKILISGGAGNLPSIWM